MEREGQNSTAWKQPHGAGMTKHFETALKAVESVPPQDNHKPKGARKLAYGVFTVIDTKAAGGKAIWCRIGAAFHHKDGGGLDVVLNALPINGRLALRKPKTEAERQNLEGEVFTLEHDEGGPCMWWEHEEHPHKRR